uniref:Uncharacterized protein n=1 Tax=Daphnia magna TaxID=35525 RepID=A0A0N8AQ24_9CRUS
MQMSVTEDRQFCLFTVLVTQRKEKEEDKLERSSSVRLHWLLQCLSSLEQSQQINLDVFLFFYPRLFCLVLLFPPTA